MPNSRDEDEEIERASRRKALEWAREENAKADEPWQKALGGVVMFFVVVATIIAAILWLGGQFGSEGVEVSEIVTTAIVGAVAQLVSWVFQIIFSEAVVTIALILFILWVTNQM